RGLYVATTRSRTPTSSAKFLATRVAHDANALARLFSLSSPGGEGRGEEVRRLISAAIEFRLLTSASTAYATVPIFLYRFDLIWFTVRVENQLTMMLNQETITNALKAVKYPGYTRDIISFGLVKNIAANNGAISITLQF